ncbi:LacI family DNA-binding transcriptional regulator [Oceanispirochaeta sp.]|uniref:LacI family DNA-binding transcriptional regulator n=1 Tax=Oceanispirochaeta sp. TaxID=2035350 RepID=UPI00261A423E|nr:LacI family DNA-binding transcriptional regulator [Oceanispirochaeta sp.]MDA3955686.1 LacI family DNA-binding transcriptional regulator [Oceanispirochaeta sp.]
MNINDIARLAGVSKATISRVLSQSPHVKEITRQRVQKIITENGYEPSHIARNLSRQKSSTIGVIIEDIANPFFISISSEIEKILYEKKYNMMISSSHWDREKELEIVQSMIRSSVDGVIIAPISPDSEAVSLLKRSGRPFIMMNSFSEDSEINYVSTDDILGGTLAAEHIFRRLRENEKIILVTGYEHQNLSRRLEGFLGYMEEKGISRQQITHYKNINNYKDGLTIASTILPHSQLRSCQASLFITNDDVAMGVLEGLLQLNLSIPEDIRILGYDNIEFSQRCRIPLTTIEQSQKDMGIIATMELLELISDPEKEVKRYLLPPRLILRESSP